MPDDKPVFRFHPGAYERGCFVASDRICDACGKPSVWLFHGLVYTAGEKPDVCARCIAGGKLSDILETGFSLHDAVFEDDADPDLEEEVMQRTPGFATFNAFSWPLLDGRPLAFLGHADEEATWKDPTAADAIRKLFRDEYEEVVKGRTSYAIVFKEIDGPRYVAIADFD